MSFPEPELADLLVRARASDAEAASALDRAWRGRLERYCAGTLGSAEEAEDAAQEVLAKVLTARDAPPPDHPRAWIYRVARNCCLNRLRTNGRRRDADALPTDFDAVSGSTGPFSALAREDRSRALARAFTALPAGEREALRLRYVEGLAREEIARVLEIDPATVKTRLFAGLARLRGRLGQDHR